MRTVIVSSFFLLFLSGCQSAHQHHSQTQHKDTKTVQVKVDGKGYTPNKSTLIKEPKASP